MTSCTQREPDPHAGCIHEQEAQEEHRCAYCDAAEVTNPDEFCSEECEYAEKIERLADQAHDALREVSP